MLSSGNTDVSVYWLLTLHFASYNLNSHFAHKENQQLNMEIPKNNKNKNDKLEKQENAEK